MVTDSNGCVDSSNVTVGNITGISVKVFENNVQIYPNPNTDHFTLEINSTTNTKLSINIYQIYGQLIYSNEITNIPGNYIQQIDLNKYAKGIYYVQIVTDSDVLTKKVIYQ